jgi:deoxycytidine triphosphate deaminase
VSVIPLIRGKTVVDSKPAFEQMRGREGEVILIMDLDKDQLLPDEKLDSNVTYDLRVGRKYRDHRDAGERELLPGQNIELAPSNAVIIETLEEVHLPRSRFGYIVPKVKWLQCGISNTSSKIDPGYPGPLLVTVFNLGKEVVSLTRGERFCTAVFHDVLPGALLYNKAPKRLAADSKSGTLSWLRDVWDRNGVTVNSIAGLIYLLLGIVLIGLSIYEIWHHL